MWEDILKYIKSHYMSVTADEYLQLSLGDDKK